jgi:hypothetical protein
MFHAIPLSSPVPPSTAVKAEHYGKIPVRDKNLDVMRRRLQESLAYSGLEDVALNQVKNSRIPPHICSVWMPEPIELFKKLHIESDPIGLSTFVIANLEKKGKVVDPGLRTLLSYNMVRSDPSNVKAWEKRRVEQPKGQLNIYEVGFSPYTYLEHAGTAYNFPQDVARAKLYMAGAIPGSLLEWVLIGLWQLHDFAAWTFPEDMAICLPGTQCAIGDDWSGYVKQVGPEFTRCKVDRFLLPHPRASSFALL